VTSICFTECSWRLRRLRACFQSKIPFLSRKCEQLVVSAYISQHVKHLTQACEGEKQSQLLSITSPLWFWRRLKLVIHFCDKFLSFLCCGISCFKNNFSSQCQKNLFHISTNIPAFVRYISCPELRLPDVLERQELSLNFLSKLVLSLIPEKHLVVLEYFPASWKILE